MTILVARGILFYMKPHKVFALQECFTLCTKAAFVNFLGKLQNTYEDLVFILNWLVSYLILDTRHVRSTHSKQLIIVTYHNYTLRRFFKYFLACIYSTLGHIFSSNNGFRPQHYGPRNDYSA